MGAHNFHTQAYGVTADEAYKEAVDAAIYDYGHDAYNGTISTTSGVVLIPLNKGEDIYDWAERVIEDKRVQKWDDCAAVADPDTPIENGRSLWHFAGWAAS